MTKLKEIIGDYESFLTDIITEIKAEGFDMADFAQMDHLCYRTETAEGYKQKKSELMAVGDLLSETNVAGRPIATFRLYQPIYFDGWRVDALELPAPKEGRRDIEGLEHVELVLFDSIPSFLKKYVDKDFKLGAADRGVNPEVGYKLPSYGVKFHLLSLPTAIYLEGKLGLTSIW